LEAGSAAGVMSEDALQYALDKRAAVTEMARILRPGGRLVVTVYELEPERAAGLPILGVGLGLFLGFGLFFEGVLGLNGTAIVGAESLLAGGLVVLGLVLLAGGLLNRRPNA